VIYLEGGYLQLLWIGGIPLLAAFIWLSIVVLRRTRELMAQPEGDRSALVTAALALWVCWWFVLILTVLDPHLTLRGTGDLLFMLIGITAGRLSVQRR
jgi:predicted small integral membrane protein